MIVVSDTTPLITLMKAKQLDVLEKLFGRVLIPNAVFEELIASDSHRDEAKKIEESDYIDIVPVSNEEAVILLQRATGLDRGESEAIIYSDENAADLLLMEELAGRRVAKSMGIRIMGAIGVLLASYNEGYLSGNEIKESLELIRASNQHISEKLIEDALSIVYEGECDKQE